LRSLILLGGNGLIGRHLRPTAHRHRWSVTTVARHPGNGIVVCRSDAEIANLVSGHTWDSVLDLRAFDDPSTRVVTQVLGPSCSYILVSSIYAYCHPSTQPERDLRNLCETAELTPSGPYGSGKVAAERAALSSSSEEVYVVRLPFVFGVGDRTGRTEALRRVATSDSEIDVGCTELGLVPAGLVAERLVRLMERRCPGRHVLNMDGGRNWTLRDHLSAARHAFSEHRSGLSESEAPFDVGRDFSLDSKAVHRLIALDIDDDLERQWADVARAW